MCVLSYFQQGFSLATRPLTYVWSSSHFISIHHPIKSGSYPYRCAILTSKFLGRTVTIAFLAASLTIALQILAKSGQVLSLITFFATLSAFPACIAISLSAVSIIATGMLTSYLIERYI